MSSNLKFKRWKGNAQTESIYEDEAVNVNGNNTRET